MTYEIKMRKNVCYHLLAIAIYLIAVFVGILYKNTLLTLLPLMFVYLEIFFIGLIFSKDVFDNPRLNEQHFAVIQLSLFVGLLFLLYIPSKILASRAINPFLEPMDYFELGSFSLIITGILFAVIGNKEQSRKKNASHRPKRICFLTLVATLIFFVIGFLLSLGSILNYRPEWLLLIRPYVQNSGFFLGAYNLLFSVAMLLDYFLEELGV